jgi:hypothetical protein
VGYESIGLEHDPAFFEKAAAGIPKLAALNGNGKDHTRAGIVLSNHQQRLALLDES